MSSTLEALGQAKLALHNLIYINWMEKIFSFQWWVLVGITIFSYALCLSLLDKRRLTQILLFGSLVAVSSIVVEIIGFSWVLWDHHASLFPIAPPVIAFDLTVVPLFSMLVYQYTSSWREFHLWNLILSGIYSFMLLPALAFLDIYELINISQGCNVRFIKY